MTEFKISDSLTEDAAYIRKTVFTDEQGFEEEFDSNDPISVHMVMYEDKKPAAVCRFYFDKERQVYILGRFAVMKEFRGRGFGGKIIREAEKQVKARGGNELVLAAQTRARGFYEKQGYKARGEEFLEEYCPHIEMFKAI